MECRPMAPPVAGNVDQVYADTSIVNASIVDTTFGRVLLNMTPSCQHRLFQNLASAPDHLHVMARPRLDFQNRDVAIEKSPE
jgi:hypothetical protein